MMFYDEKQMACTLVSCLSCQRALYMPVVRLPCVECTGYVSAA